METTREADSGYPEENPPAAVPEDAGAPERSSVRESARATEAADRAPSNDDGTATGDERSAGAPPEHGH
jgi:hypothetical protein